MALKITASDHDGWRRHGLAEFAGFADKVRRRNGGPDHGDWFHPAERPDHHDAVLYFGTWDAGHPAGDPAHTVALIYDITDPDEAVEYMLRVTDWEGQPEADEQPVGGDD